MTSSSEAFVWIWLPGATDPVVAGKLIETDGVSSFTYGRSYLDRDNAISLFPDELPLRGGAHTPRPGLTLPGCLRDAAPDAWGRRVILHRLHAPKNADPAQLTEITYLLASGSDRVGALDFQTSPTNYVARTTDAASLDELHRSAERVEAGLPLTPELDAALLHGSSIGGARPKATLDDEHHKYIAKFSSTSDIYNVIKAELVAMRLAARVGLHVAPVSLARACGRDVLLVERFDRQRSTPGWTRRGMLSALTLLGLDEMMARYASYEDLAEIVRHRFSEPTRTLRELFGRLVFNILCGNTDDHARNHAAFWDGRKLSLTPAYDICPQARSGNIASQAMLICGDHRESKLASCLNAASSYLLSRREALGIITTQIERLIPELPKVCEEAGVQQADYRMLTTRQFLNPFAFEDLTGEDAALQRLAEHARASWSKMS